MKVDQYKLTKWLGAGLTADVYEGSDAEGQAFAVKIFFKDFVKNKIDLVREEMDNMRRVDCKHNTKLIYFSENGQLYDPEA